MIHINKSTDNKFYVTVIAKNGEVLNTSETLNSKQAAWKNIKSLYMEMGSAYPIFVTDNTVKKPVKYSYSNLTGKNKLQ